MVLSSMEVAWATDVAVGYRRPVRGGPISSGLRPLAIEVVLQDRVDASVGAGADLKRTRAGGLEPPGPVRRREPQDADAGPEALLGMRALCEDDLDQRRGAAPDLSRAPPQALQCPVGMAPMARRHVLTHRRVAAVRGGADMRGDALAAMEDFDGARRDAHPHLLAQQLVRRGVVVLLDLDVIVEPEPALLPLGVDVGLCRQCFERRPLQLLEQRLAARAQVPRDAGIEGGDLDGDGRILRRCATRIWQLGEREELPLP